ncbi:MAG: RICIN domain-containing protein [Renibacterium sp.]|nr:RICIN domain-containing protein [Renibacterium sp.]
MKIHKARSVLAGIAAACLGVALLPAQAQAADSYTITSGPTKSYAYPTDTPANPFIDKDGTFYFQQSAALYGADLSSNPRQWEFYTGTNFDNAKKSPISNAVNPANAQDKNNDTTWRCNNSPTGLTSTYAPNNASYSQRNYCDLSSVWVDPDSGDWYGLVHNEFTPSPFGDGLHYDAIDYAVSSDQGKTWTIKDKVITSPYSTTRGDTAAFPNQTYYYGDGDQRLLVDTASGYFYVYYGSRVVNKTGGWGGFMEHVARAPISQKMAPGSWQKYFEGQWQTPGLGGKESNIVSVSSSYPDGYVPTAQDYDPANTGTINQQVAAGKLLKSTDLFVMNVSYNAYLGMYIGTPETDGIKPLRFYGTKDLATQQWVDLGSTPNYSTSSWYRWMVDSATGTTGNILGKTFRSYCSISCSKNANGNQAGGEYLDVTIGSSAPAAPVVDPAKAYLISSASGKLLSQSGTASTAVVPTASGAASEAWKFKGNGDGSYTITNAGSGLALGVPATPANRAWGSTPVVGTVTAGNVGQQWFVQAGTGQSNSYRIINRYSGLVISLGEVKAQTSPYRNWTKTAGTTPDTSTPQSQTISLQETNVANSGSSLTGVASGRCLDVAGQSANNGATANIGDCIGAASQLWNPSSAGELKDFNGGKCLDLFDNKTAPGSPVGIWSCNGGANQKWTLKSDGTIVSVSSGLCLDVMDNATAAGSAVKVWTCSGAANQQWR